MNTVTPTHTTPTAAIPTQAGDGSDLPVITFAPPAIVDSPDRHAPSPFTDRLRELGRRVKGDVVAPADPRYDSVRRAWNLTVDQRPAVVVVAGEVADVAMAVRFARANNLRVAVQATGHGIARAADGALLIVTARLDRVEIDAVARVARVSAGAKWGAVLAPAQAHGLAPLLGSTTDVGAVGYTLGGGMGWLARKHGLATDSVRSFDLVTPDGIEVHVSDTEQPELFWALKGGGGGTLGVVTSMEVDLYPVDVVYAGNLLYPVEMAREVMARWREWVAGVGTDLTSSVVLMNFPPFDDVPEPIRGGSFVIVRGCWVGDLDEGRALIDEWRTWSPPALDMFGEMPFSQADTISNDPVDPMPAMVTTEWFDELDDVAIDVLVEATVPAPNAPPRLIFSEIRHAGGAMRDATSANDRGRSGEFLLEMVGLAMDPELGAALDAHLRETRRRLAPFVTGATYLNFTEGAEKQERTESAFSAEHLDRVRAVKTAVDGEDRFSHGLAITPA
jgi:hypothetical protein